MASSIISIELILDEIVLRKSDAHQVSIVAETAAQLLSEHNSSLQNQRPHTSSNMQASDTEAVFKTTIIPAWHVHSFVSQHGGRSGTGFRSVNKIDEVWASMRG